MADRNVKSVSVISGGTMQKLGYETKYHPDGYIYFAKCNPSPKPEITHTRDVDDVNTAVEHQSEDSLTSDSPNVASDTQSNAEEAVVKIEGFLPTEQQAQWALQLKHAGYARCANTKCNFISLSIEVITEHYQSCQGIPVYDILCCKQCSNRVLDIEREAHIAQCTAKLTETLPLSNPAQNSSNNIGIIIQPSPPQPKGTYVRRRCYNSKHKQDWTQKLDTHHYIRCHFQNCSFLAMSLEDMILHYGLCCGDNSFAQFRCNHCDGCVTSQEVLDIHIERSHSNIKTDTNHKEASKPEAPPVMPVLSKLIEPWRETFSNIGYVMCPKCLLICVTVEEMCLHYGQCKGKKSTSAKFVCTYCSGRAIDQNNLDLHVRSSHTDRELVFTLQHKQRGPAIKQYPRKCKRERFEIPSPLNQSGVEEAVDIDYDFKNADVKDEITITDIEVPIAEDTASDAGDLPTWLDEPELELATFDQTSHSEFGKISDALTNQTEKLPVSDNVSANPTTTAPCEKASDNEIEGAPADTDQDPPNHGNSEGDKEMESLEKMAVSDEPTPKLRKKKRKMETHNRKGRSKRFKSSDSEEIPISELKVKQEQVLPKKKSSKNSNKVVCGKCTKSMKNTSWAEHNAEAHAGLGWLEGETPIDIDAMDPVEVKSLLRTAFKITSQAQCEKCNAIKKSFLGFHSHIMICGKSGEEIVKSLAVCTVCGKGVKPVSLRSHMRIHESQENDESIVVSHPKRQSALRAMTILQNETNSDTKSYAVIRKGEDLPESVFSTTVRGPNCSRPNCDKKLPKSQNRALNHYFNCPTLPDIYYQCLECSTFSLNENEAKEHETQHNKIEDAEYNEKLSDAEDNEIFGSDDEENSGANVESRFHVSTLFKRTFRSKNRMTIRYGPKIYDLAFEQEMARQRETIDQFDSYPDFHTKTGDWIQMKSKDLQKYMPPLSESLPIKYNNQDVAKKCKVFQTAKEMNGFFVGGAVKNLAWCPIHIDRSTVNRQLLAISVSSEMEYYPSLLTTKTKSTLLQIWNAGNPEREPFLLLGLALDYGELWDFTWSPFDTWAPKGDENLERLGLIAMAFNDGVLRIFSIANLKSKRNLPIYKVHPIAALRTRLLTGNGEETSCLKVSWNPGGIICAGYRSGVVSLWNFKQTSRRIKGPNEKTFNLYPYRTFLAQLTPITGLSFCPKNSSILITTGGDRIVKRWDLRTPPIPFRSDFAIVNQIFCWMKNWPAVMYLESANDVCVDTPPNLRNFCYAHFKSPSDIKDISFSDWLYTTAISNENGEVVLRYNSDTLNDCPKYSLRSGFTNMATKTKLTSDKIFTSYSEVEESGCDILFEDLPENNSIEMGSAPPRISYPIIVPEKISFNPNYRCFNQLAIGYRCGIVRIYRLNHLQSAIDECIPATDSQPST